MRAFFDKVPVPTGGVALGLAALGILLRPYSEIVYVLCGLFSFALLLLLGGKLLVASRGLRKDFENPILASVSATAFMALMQLTTYVAPIAYLPALAVWGVAVALHAALIVWFTIYHVRKFDLSRVYPTYFICYVGIVVASVSSPTYGLEALGSAIFWFGFAAYLVLLVVVTARYAKHPVEEGARPLFCIYTAPMSLSLVGYLSTATDPNLVFACVLAVFAQLLLVVVLFRLSGFLRLPFYPSYAAMTFPFVITATALTRILSLLAENGVAFPGVLHVLALAETVLAVAMVAYVFVRYLMFFGQIMGGSRSASQTAHAVLGRAK